MRTERNKETISYHLKSIGKISINNFKKWFNGGANALQKAIDVTKGKLHARKVAKCKKFLAKANEL